MIAGSLLLVLVLTGLLVQVVAERRDAAANPPPGELVALPDGRSLHLQVAGEDHDGPTVVLEAGAGAFSAAWAWVQPAVAEQYTVVSYDRAGLGWSEVSDHGPAAEAVVADLHTVLQARGLPGPYVLVGHSLGSHYVRAFAAAHPEDVAGVVLVDPSHEHQAAALGEDYDLGTVEQMYTALEIATQLGLTRVYNPFAAALEALPEPQRSQYRAEQLTVGNVRSSAAEIAAMDTIGAGVAGSTLGEVPLRVLIAASAPAPQDQEQVDALVPLRQDLAGLSSNGEAIVLPEAEHISIVAEREHAADVTAAILEVSAAATLAATG